VKINRRLPCYEGFYGDLLENDVFEVLEQMGASR
jgi:hypothetical protein